MELMQIMAAGIVSVIAIIILIFLIAYMVYLNRDRNRWRTIALKYRKLNEHHASVYEKRMDNNHNMYLAKRFEVINTNLFRNEGL